MQATWAPRLTLVAAWLTVSCGGKAALDATDNPEPVAVDCTELQHTADAALERLVATNNACDSDADCDTIESIGACYTYCIVPVRRASVNAVRQSGRDLCRSYVENACASSYACPNTPGVACIAGRCAFSF